MLVNRIYAKYMQTARLIQPYSLISRDVLNNKAKKNTSDFFIRGIF